MVRVLQQLLRGEWRSQCRQRFFCTVPHLTPPLQVSERSPEARAPAPFPYTWGLFQLMAVPKRKVSRSKKGIRNGPKALKPQPVIVRCTFGWNRDKDSGLLKIPYLQIVLGRVLRRYAAQFSPNKIETAGYRLRTARYRLSAISTLCTSS
ncbi:hypothetical protein L7F22_013173 [Adiantum nelumboides]|nr:hypothetical protein [Adiantum nelumboides]